MEFSGGPVEERRVIRGWRCLLDLLTFGAISAVVLVLQFVTPFQRGFFCNDETIVYPFKPSTITSAVMFVVVFAVTLVLMTLNTVRLARHQQWSSSPKCVLEFCGKRMEVQAYLVHLVHFFFMFMVGAAINQLITDIGKVTIGRLRPNFISVCQPDYSRFNCTNTHGVPQYVLGDFCTAAESKVQDSRKSWPSGHSSAAVYGMVFTVLYLEYCYTLRRTPVLRNLVNSILLAFAFCTVLSRIDDNKHHWTDVLSGSLIGAAVAFSMFWANFPMADRVHYLQPQADDHLPHAMYLASPGVHAAGSSNSLDRGEPIANDATQGHSSTKADASV